MKHIRMLQGSLYNSAKLALTRSNADGSLDAGFGGGGEITTDFGNDTDDQASALALQPDGKIIVGDRRGR